MGWSIPRNPRAASVSSSTQLTRRPSTSSEFRRPGGPALHPSRARGAPSSRAPPPPAPWRDAS
eukprot:5429824-Alexandrium_andersonii.AAC.1